MTRIVEGQPHQNIILKCTPLSAPIWKSNSTLPKGINIYCDKITDPQNFGAILRSCLFFGVSEVFTGKKHHCPLNTTVSKTSAGAM
jgi:tRNA G18 (ribose-2'-O)-methylase SpoU